MIQPERIDAIARLIAAGLTDDECDDLLDITRSEGARSRLARTLTRVLSDRSS